MEFSLINIAISVLVYPGLLVTFGLGWLYWRVVDSASGNPYRWSNLRSALQYREGALAIVSIALAGIGMALLPWPYNPAEPSMLAWIWAWMALELAFLAPILPALTAGDPLIVRAAIRRAQIGVASRSWLWMGLAVGLILYADWRWLTLPAHLLTVLAAGFALPAAMSWGPYTAEVSVTPEGSDQGLPDAVKAVNAIARHVGSAALLATSLVALLPLSVAPNALAMVELAGGWLAISVIFRRLDGIWPRLPLPEILHICLFRVLPLSTAAVLYLAIIQNL